LSGCQFPGLTKLTNTDVNAQVCPQEVPQQCPENPVKPEKVEVIIEAPAQIDVMAILSSTSGKKATVRKDSYLVPYDMSQWSCDEYIEQAQAEGHLWRLQKLLQYRPHQYHAESGLADLSLLPLSVAPKQRNRATFHYHKVHQDVLPDLLALLKAANQAGYPLRVQSAFRSVDRQNLLWQGSVRRQKYQYKKAAYRVAPPCFSEHATGRAVDFSLPSIHTKVASHPVYRWLQKYAADYGWEQSFIKGEPGVASHIKSPGVMAEAWHFRHRSIHR